MVVIGLPEHRLTVPPAQCAASLLPGNHAWSKRNGCHRTSPALYRIRVRGFVHAGAAAGRFAQYRMSAAGRDVTQLVAVTLRVTPHPSTGQGASRSGMGAHLPTGRVRQREWIIRRSVRCNRYHWRSGFVAWHVDCLTTHEPHCKRLSAAVAGCISAAPDVIGAAWSRMRGGNE